MPQSFASLHCHIVFSTKHRQPQIKPDMQPRLFEYIGGILRNHSSRLIAAGGMPDHVHLIFTPLVNQDAMEIYSLAEIMDAIKGASAHKINKRLRRKGRFWQAESFDHWVRNEGQFVRIKNYIENNPVKAGLVAKAEDWLWSSASK